MTRSESITELAKAMVKAQRDFGPLIKGSINPFFKSKYSDLAAVMDVARGPLAENELFVTQTTDADIADGFLAVETTLVHSSGEWIAGCLKIPLVKNDPQGLGSAMTYARRYALQAILGLAAEDDDGEAATRGNGRQGPNKTTPATSASPQQSSQSDTLIIQGEIEDVSIKTGTDNNGPWKKYGIKINGSWYGTFSDTIGELAEAHKGQEVTIVYTIDGKYNTATELTPLAPY